MNKLKGYRTYIAIVAFVVVSVCQVFLGLTPEETDQARETSIRFMEQLEHIQILIMAAIAWFMRSGIKETEKKILNGGR